MYKSSLVILTTGTNERLTDLSKLLCSISKQAVEPSELIIASEATSPELEKLLEKYFCPCENHKIISTGYWNRCKTANEAIRKARGSIIFLLEDDLILKDNFIEEMAKSFDSKTRIGCVYSRCSWVYHEGLRNRAGIKGFMAKIVSTLSIHQSILSKQTKRLDHYLCEVPVFTMSVACRREALYKAGLYDENVSEPISGEDYDLALRIRKAGYRIVMNAKAISHHFTRQVTKRVTKIHDSAKYLSDLNESELYFVTKNRDILGVHHVMLHVAYRALESIAWAVRAKNAKASIYGIAGTLRGFAKGLLV